MKYTLNLIRRGFCRGQVPVSPISGQDTEFGRLRFFPCPDDPEPGALYLSEAADNTILLRTESACFSVLSGTYLAICAAVIEICQYYDVWEKDLNGMIWEQADFQQLVDRSEDMFRNPVFLSNWQGYVLGFSRSFKDAEIRPFWTEVTQKHRVPPTTLAAILDSEYKTYLDIENAVHLLSFPDLNYRSIFGLVHIHSEIVLQFQIIEYNEPLSDADLTLAGVFLNILKNYFRRNELQDHNSAQDVFRRLLRGEDVPPDILNWALDYFGWSVPSAQYHLILYTGSDGSACQKILFPQIERLLPGGRLIETDGQAVMIIPAAVFPEIRDELSRVLKLFRLYAAVSLPFQEWNNLAGTLEQSRLVLAECSEQTPLCFSLQHAWKLLTHTLSGEAERLSLLHPASLTLRDYDQKNHSQLAKTLLQYLLCERSSMATASALFIHRNSLKYRLERIRDLIDPDLDDPDTRMHLILSLMILSNRE